MKYYEVSMDIPKKLGMNVNHLKLFKGSYFKLILGLLDSSFGVFGFQQTASSILEKGIKLKAKLSSSVS